MIGFYKKASGRPSVTWPEAVDEAIRAGWIDGKVQRIDDESHRQRFTPRKSGSIWSKVNVAKAEALIAAGEMLPAGLRAYEARTEKRSGVYSYEQDVEPELGPAYEGELRANPSAWDYWEARPRGYRRAAAWWVVGAKREETRRRRLATLVEDCAAGRPVKHLARP